MRTKKVHVPNDENGKQEVLLYLSKDFSLKETFKRGVEVYNENMKTREMAVSKNVNDIEKLNGSFEAGVAWEMFLLLVVGVKEAVFYLAGSFINGFGIRESEFLTSLTVAIGLKLKNPDILELMKDEAPASCEIQDCANKCVNKINVNAKEVAGRSSLSYEELIGYSKEFDQLVKTFGHSYYDNIKESSIRQYADYVELNDGNHPDVALAGNNESSCNCIIL